MVVALPELGNVLVDGRPWKPDHGEQRFALTGGGPIQGAALGVGVDQQDAGTVPREAGSEVHGQRRLPDAAFLVQQTNDHYRLFFRIYGITILRLNGKNASGVRRSSARDRGQGTARR
ncbi:hypothetical protein XAP6164_4910006 [Xanthomonas phaseoli pv. phaseoli]|nr:hypothetical protein XAP6164_4910006 [Xanthomonas phaseoli pv. phaseoli]